MELKPWGFYRVWWAYKSINSYFVLLTIKRIWKKIGVVRVYKHQNFYTHSSLYVVVKTWAFVIDCLEIVNWAKPMKELQNVWLWFLKIWILIPTIHSVILQLTIIFPKKIRSLDCLLKLCFGGSEKYHKINFILWNKVYFLFNIP